MGLLKRSSRLQDPTTFKDVNPDDIKFVEIFPPIGVARLGDSTDEYFLGPELPFYNDNRANNLPTQDNKFRDTKGSIRRQAARFRVYAYDKNNKILGEVNLHNGYTLTWTVHVVNMKAAGNTIAGDALRNPGVQGNLRPHERTKLIVDPKEKIISRTDGNEVIQLDGTFEGTFTTPKNVNLGQLQVDDAGRLVFIGAKGGIFGTVPPSAESLDFPDCVDDACDGWVNVTIKKGQKDIPARHKAAVLSGPPKFSWDLRSTTSIFDLIEDVYQGNVDIGEPEFYVDIWPVLEATSLMSWVDPETYKGHNPGRKRNGDFIFHRTKLEKKDEGQDYKGKVFKTLRNPNGGGRNMPKLNGDGALTKLQYGRFSLWKDHKFQVTQLEVVAQLEEMAPEEQVKCLTRANLEMTIGGSFSPGIEACNIVKDHNTYKLTALNPPYRVDFSNCNIRPGDFTVGLSLPWQSDFQQCQEAWWPAVRPVSVKNNPDPNSVHVRWARGAEGEDGRVMLESWHLLGFVIRPLISADTRIESERKLPEDANEAGA